MRPIRNGRMKLGFRYNERYDTDHGISTTGQTASSALDVESGNKMHGYGYGATPIKPFRDLLRSLGLDWKKYAFIDYGCGKGRALFLASEFPFRRIIGVDYARDMIAIAKRNIMSFRHPRQQCFDIRCTCSDAVAFPLPASENCVCYFYTPFDHVLFDRIVETLTQSYECSPRHILICCARQANHVGEDFSAILDRSRVFSRRQGPRLRFDWLSHPQVEMIVYETSSP